MIRGRSVGLIKGFFTALIMQGNNQKDGSGSKTPSLSWSQPAAASSNTASPKTTPITTPRPPVVTPSTYGRGGLTGAFVVGLIIGVLVGWGWSALRETTSTSTASSATSTATTTNTRGSTSATPKTSAATSGSITVAPQAAGLRVNVSGVSVTKPTWVVVYESTGGTPGSALGAKLFFPASQGGSASGAVTLLRTTRAGQTYLVGQHVDNGDGKFSKQSDTAVMTDGTQVLASFKAN